MLSRIGLIVSLFALASNVPGHAATKTKPPPATSKPAAAAGEAAATASEAARALMACRRTVKGAEATPKPAVKATRSATAKAAPKADLSVCVYTLAHALRTFADACQAGAAGTTVLHAGACNDAFCPQGCVADRAVTARRVANGQVKTYDNICWAEKDHAVFLHYAKCPH